ncbi:MAG: hypothetical protein AAF514_12595, partial [Verrucomicrobiota bacterium]
MPKIEKSPNGKSIRWGRNKRQSKTIQITFFDKEGGQVSHNENPRTLIDHHGFFFAKKDQGEAFIGWPLFRLSDADSLWDGEE